MLERRASLLFLSLLAPAAGGCISYDDSAAIFDRTRLHKVELYVSPSDLSALETSVDSRVPCSVTYDGETVEGAGVRQKGSDLHTLKDKPSFNVKIDEFDASASLFGLTKLFLNSSSKDKTFMRELIGADMSARADLPAPRAALAVVSLNDADLGIYVVGEAVTKDFLRDRFGGAGDGNLYGRPCCGDFVDDTAAMELDGEADEGRSRDDITELAESIKSAPDSAFSEQVGEHLALSQFITSYALDAALGRWDGYSYRGNNYLLYDNPEDDRFVFLPDGMDRILEDARFDTETAPFGRLPLRVRSIQPLLAEFDRELARVVADVWDEPAVLASIDQASQVIHAASAGEATSDDVARFDKHVGDLRALVTERRALLDPAIVCGDGKVQGLEACDDGNTTGGDGCSARCRAEAP